MFIIYKHTFKSTGKSYIGYTSKGLQKRLITHVRNAMSGVDTHFYRAIRKYGVDDMQSEILFECESFEKIKEMEKYYIAENKTFEEGYNMTKGGDGGWSVPDEKYQDWLLQRSMPMEKNGRFSGHADDEILECAYNYFNKVGYYSVASFTKYSSEKYGMPKSYSKNRFNGKSFKEAYCEKYGIDKSKFKYIQTNEHKKNNSKSFFKKNTKWYHNENLKQSKQFAEVPGNEWKLGRKIKWD